MRASGGTADPDFLALATRLQGPLVDWLSDHGFDMVEDAPRAAPGRAGEGTPRTYWGPEGGRSILNVLSPMLEAHRASGRIDLLLETPAEALIIEEGRVTGVRTANGRAFLGEAVLLTSGGYGANPALFARIHDGATLWSGSYAHATGKGLELGLAAGGLLIYADRFLPNFGGVIDPTVSPPRYRAPGGLAPSTRPPWEIVVNAEGARFHPEDAPNEAARAAALMNQTDARAWVIYDEAIRRSAPSIFSYFPAAKAASFYGPGGPVVRADSLAALAKACGIAAGGLQRTVADYNASVASGVDPLGRRHMPRTIAAAPYYALPIAAYTVRTPGGLKVDIDFRVLDASARPIPGLYAAGEILGALLSGPGARGMSLGPALAFGKHLGERLPVA
jgi:fumarate reductase flavoprotein subunit